VNRAIDLARLRTGERPALAAAIAAAGLVCFPTDTVYGIGGVVSPVTGRAIAQTKGRLADKPLQVVYPTLELLLDGVALSPAVADAARRLLPGPFTLVVPYPDGMTFPPFGLVTWPAAGGKGDPDHGGEGGYREGGPGGATSGASGPVGDDFCGAALKIGCFFARSGYCKLYSPSLVRRRRGSGGLGLMHRAGTRESREGPRIGGVRATKAEPPVPS